MTFKIVLSFYFVKHTKQLIILTKLDKPADCVIYNIIVHFNLCICYV